jgi:hypothetical protein
MWALRLLAAAAAIAFFLGAVRAYQRRHLSRLTLIMAFLAALAVVLLAAFPNLLNPVFDTFNFTPGNNRRIIALLVAAVVVLFLMLFRLQGHSDTSEQAIRQLVEALADLDQARAQFVLARRELLSAALERAKVRVGRQLRLDQADAAVDLLESVAHFARRGAVLGGAGGQRLRAVAQGQQGHGTPASSSPMALPATGTRWRRSPDPWPAPATSFSRST